jgi:hypothetical protein
MRRTESVEIRITKERKERWENEVEKSNEVNNLSDLIRLSVVQKINGVLDEEAINEIPLDIDDEKLVAKLSDLEETNSKIIEEISDIKSGLGDGDEVIELSRDLQSMMVEVPSEDSIEDVKPTGLELVDDQVSIIGTAEAFSDYFDKDIGLIRQALSRAKRQNPNVEYTYTEYGERRYYKINPNISELHIPENVDTEGFKTVTEMKQE